MIDWKIFAKSWLKDYNLRARSVGVMELELSRLQHDFERIRSSTADGSPVKGSGAPTRDDVLISNIVQRGEIEQSIAATREWLDVYRAAWDQLEPGDKRLLEKMYVNRAKGNPEQLRQELMLEDLSSVYRRTEKALERFTVLLYGRTES